MKYKSIYLIASWTIILSLFLANEHCLKEFTKRLMTLQVKMCYILTIKLYEYKGVVRHVLLS